MLVVFEAHLLPGSDAAEILSAEVLKETQAKVMTPAQAKKAGFGGLPDFGPNVVLVAVAKRDSPWIQKALDMSPLVSGFRVHEVG